MGQGKDRSLVRKGQPGHSPKRSARRVKPVALAAAGLTLLSIALSQTPAPAPAQFDKGLAWNYLVKQVDFGPRKPSTDAHLSCRDYLEAELKKTCENVRLEPFDHVWSRNGQTIHMWNIIGEQNWAKSTTRVMLLAHWDSRPTADQDPDPAKRSQPIPGADDGASGVAVLLELARALHVQPANVGVMYVLLDGEDLGPDMDEMLLGARVLAKDLPNPRPDYAILLDMIGNRGVTVPMEPNSYHYAPTLEKSLYAFAEKIGLKDAFPTWMGPEIEDDHLPMNEAGVPTIDLIDFNYPSWHTVADTPDKCSPDSLGKVGDLLQQWLRKPDVFRIGAEGR
jgi:hypothetical protein